MTTLIPKFDLKNGGTTPAGAINRTIYEKLSDFVSVKDFGAVGEDFVHGLVALDGLILSEGYEQIGEGGFGNSAGTNGLGERDEYGML